MKYLSLSLFAISLSVLLGLSACVHTTDVQKEETPLFTFAFLTDIHLQPERNAIAGFSQAIELVNELNPDFVITGGDLIYDALGQGYGRADSLYVLYDSMQQLFNIPVYNTMGNHELFGLYEKSGVSPEHPEFGKKIYENRITSRYYSFDHQGWHFVVVDAIGTTPSRRYFGEIDSTQISWINEDLASLDSTVPIVLISHIPLTTTFVPYFFRNQIESDSGIIVTNSKAVIDLFDEHNLLLVLQGHTHILEDVFVDNIHFVTGGAVSGRWWRGPNLGTEEGFLLVSVYPETYRWEYIDMRWEVQPD